MSTTLDVRLNADGTAVPMASSESPRTLPEAVRYFVSRGSPRFLMSALALAAIARVSLGDWRPLDLAVVLVIWALWPVQEWLIHVFILHQKPFRLFGFTIDSAVPRKHRAHHRDPWNIDTLFIPIQGFMIALPILLALCLFAAPTSSLAMTALTFYLLMACRYEWTHFLVHTRYRPKTARFKKLWRNHRLHHCKNENYWFGVTMLGGDRLLGTAPERDAVETSATCMTLGDEDAAEL